MKKNVLYRQCRLVKQMRNGEMIQTSYIPAEFARRGRVVKLRNEDTWDDGWEVRVVGDALTEDELTALSHAHQKWEREARKD
jgi:hypothetical protein